MKQKQLKLRIPEIFRKKLGEVKIDDSRIEEIHSQAENIRKKLNESCRKYRVKADIFIGGSLAKRTIVGNGKLDVDIYVRFHKESNSEIFSKIVKNVDKTVKIIHGSRDYAQIDGDNLLFEIIPVLKIKSPKEANNVTDLSYFHVNYVLGKIKKKKKLVDEIILAKTFTHAANCYGAESYIRGFSGYAIELLMIHYGSLLKFIETIANSKERIMVDTEKHYKKGAAMREINEAKLSSPIILVDPTFRERNALASLSKETYERFKDYCTKFLKNPSEKFFEQKKINPENIRMNAEKKGRDYGVIEVGTNKQAGDIAGTKLLKFARLFIEEMKRYFIEPEINFEYDEEQRGKIYFTGKSIDKKIIRGPPIDKIAGCEMFRKKYGKKVRERRGILEAEIEVDLSIKKSLEEFKKIHSRTMKEMGITELRLLG